MLVDGDTADQSDTTSMRVLFIVCEHADYSLMYSLKSKDEEVNILKRASKILTVTLTNLESPSNFDISYQYLIKNNVVRIRNTYYRPGWKAELPSAAR